LNDFVVEGSQDEVNEEEWKQCFAQIVIESNTGILQYSVFYGCLVMSKSGLEVNLYVPQQVLVNVVVAVLEVGLLLQLAGLPHHLLRLARLLGLDNYVSGKTLKGLPSEGNLRLRVSYLKRLRSSFFNVFRVLVPLRT